MIEYLTAGLVRVEAGRANAYRWRHEGGVPAIDTGEREHEHDIDDAHQMGPVARVDADRSDGHVVGAFTPARSGSRVG